MRSSGVCLWMMRREIFGHGGQAFAEIFLFYVTEFWDPFGSLPGSQSLRVAADFILPSNTPGLWFPLGYPLQLNGFGSYLSQQGLGGWWTHLPGQHGPVNGHGCPWVHPGFRRSLGDWPCWLDGLGSPFTENSRPMISLPKSQ